MLNGFKTQAIRDAENGPELHAELARTRDERAAARKALETIHELADAILRGDAATIDRIQAQVKADAQRPDPAPFEVVGAVLVTVDQ